MMVNGIYKQTTTTATNGVPIFHPCNLIPFFNTVENVLWTFEI